MGDGGDTAQLVPRLCHIVRCSDFNCYGFNLHAEKGQAGQFIGKVDEGSPAVAAGLKQGDRIVEVNGTNVGYENHQQVVARIKAGGDETRLLVVDAETDQYYKDDKRVVRGDLPEVLKLTALRDGQIGTSLSPSTEEHFNVLLRAVQAREAHLLQDKDGKVQTVYKNVKRINPLTHVDKSKAHTIQEGKTAEDVRTRSDVCLEMIEAIKENRTPSGVVIDRSKVKTSAQGKYEEGKQFERLQEVLGKGNCAGDIVVVKDNKTETEHAVKAVMISEFSPDEVRAWVDLGESESFPSLYLFRLVDNKIVFHMEKIEHGVTLDDIINQHMNNLCQKAPDLKRPFSLCMFHGLLSALKEMHDKNWSHRDLHGGNVMMTKGTMTLKILDFGMARPLRQPGLNFNHDGLKNDILNAIRLFCGLYIGRDFENNFVLEGKIKSGTLKTLLETSGLKESEKEELLQLIAKMYHMTQDPTQAGYGDITPVLENIEHSVYPDKMKDVLRTAAAILFPDYYYGARDDDLQGGADGRGDREDEDKVLDPAAAAVPDELLNRLCISVPTCSSDYTDGSS